jgi:hypothetical protein
MGPVCLIFSQSFKREDIGIDAFQPNPKALLTLANGL